MALTSFTDGVTVVTAAWLNQVFGSAGHVHDGVNDDGSAPKIDDEIHIDFDNADRLCRVYTDLDTAIDDLSAGETCIVDETDPTKAFLETLWTDAFTGGGGGGKWKCETDGEYIYWADDTGKLFMIDRSGSEIVSITLGIGSAVVRDIAADGQKVAVASGSKVNLYNRATLLNSGTTPEWSYNHGANMIAVDIDGNAVFFGGVANGSSVTHGQLNYSTGALDQNANAGGAVYGIVTDGEYVWVCGNRSAGNIILRVQDYDLSSTIISEVDANADGRYVDVSRDYVVLLKTYNASSDKTVKCYSKSRFSAFELVWEKFGINWNPQHLVCDDRYVYVAGDDVVAVGSVLVFDIQTGALVGHKDFGSADAWGVATDGFVLYVAHDDLGSGEGLSALYLGRGPTPCYRAAPTDRYRQPYHQLMLPGR